METMKSKTLMLRQRSRSWRETIQKATAGRYSREKDIAHEEKKLQISLPRNDFKHTAHIGINGESFGETGFLTKQEIEARRLPPPEKNLLQKALTMNKSNSNNSMKKVKSPVLEHSITIVRPDRPLVSRRRNDSDDESDDELPPTFEADDMLSSVLAVMGTDGEQETKTDNATITPYQKVQPEESSSESETEKDDDEIATDEIQAGPNHTDESYSEPGKIKKDQTSTSTNESASFSIRSSVSDNQEIRQKKLDAIVSRFNNNSLRSNVTLKSSEYTDSEDEEHNDGEAFSLDDDDDESVENHPEVKLRSSGKDGKTENRRSLIDQIKSKELHILGHKNSLSTSEREIML